MVERRVRLLKKHASLVGIVVRGFNRGSRTLGFPTANLEGDTDKEKAKIKDFLEGHENGIYFGFVQVSF